MCAVIGAYKLYKEEVGWDVPEKGAIKRLQPPLGTSEEELAQCARYCNRTSNCDLFTYYGEYCYLKAATGATPIFVGEGEYGWRRMYVK
jgi:hypothetical protein